MKRQLCFLLLLSASLSVNGEEGNVFAQKLNTNHLSQQVLVRFENSPEWELYDLKKALVEFVDLSNNPVFTYRALRLRQALLDWQKQAEDQFIDAEFIEAVKKRTSRRPIELSFNALTWLL